MSTTETKVMHTPGPWIYDEETGSVRSALPSKRCVAQTNWMLRKHHWSEHAANVRIIATAPDMLEALEAAHAALVAIRKHILPNVSGQTRDFHEEIDAAAAAIAKAKGGAA